MLDRVVGSVVESCPACGQDGIVVSTRTRPRSGCLDLDDAIVHEHDDRAYYHVESR